MGNARRREHIAGTDAAADTPRRSDGHDEAEALTGDAAVRACFVELQGLGKQWMEKERAGIALIESFQTALLATRTASSGPIAADAKANKKPSPPAGAMEAFMDGATESSAAQMDPWLAEDLFAQIQELPGAFTELLERMYAIQREIHGELEVDTAVEPDHPLQLTVADYAQFVAHEVATFEAEYQHVEALLAMITFIITTDQLRTLVISWSTSPFLDPERSREFRQRHEQSQKIRSS